MPKFRADTVAVIKVVKGWRKMKIRGGMKGKGSCFVLVPKQWAGEEVSVTNLETKEKVKGWVVGSTGMSYVKASCEWLGKEVIVSLDKYLKPMETKKGKVITVQNQVTV